MSHHFLVYSDEDLTELKHSERLSIQEGFHEDNIYEAINCVDKRLSTSGNNTVSCFVADFGNRDKTFNNTKTERFLEAIADLKISPIWIKFC